MVFMRFLLMHLQRHFRCHPKPTSYAQTIAAVKAFIESQMSEKEIVGLSIALVDAERDDLGNMVWRQEIIQRIFWNCTSVRCKKFRKILQIIIEKSV
jgi:hypothetical protein